jgi:hypothetical protein
MVSQNRRPNQPSKEKLEALKKHLFENYEKIKQTNEYILEILETVMRERSEAEFVTPDEVIPVYFGSVYDFQEQICEASKTNFQTATNENLMNMYGHMKMSLILLELVNTLDKGKQQA